MAQPQTGRLPEAEKTSLVIDGVVGVEADLYNASDEDLARREARRGRLFAQLAAVRGGVRYGVDLLLASAESERRLSPNRFGVSAAYRWARLQAGDVTPDLSRYSLSGLTVRGGAVSLTPSRFTVTAVAGQTRLASRSSALISRFRPAAFAQRILAGRVGAGPRAGTHLHLVATYARDLAPSLDDVGGARPAENATLTPQAGLVLWEGRARLRAELTASATTPDTRLDESPDRVVPPLLDNLVTTRPGTHVDYAFHAEGQVELDEGGLVRASYERVAPGFVSLGLPYLRRDQAVWRLEPSVRLWQRRLLVRGDFARRTNNLAGQRLATLRRWQAGLTAQAQVTPTFSFSAAYLGLFSRSDPEARYDELSVRQATHTLLAAPVVTFQRGAVWHSASASASVQVARDEQQSGLGASEYDNVALTATYTVRLPSTLAVTASASTLRSSVVQLETTARRGVVVVSRALLGRQLTLSVRGSAGRTRAERRGSINTATSTAQWKVQAEVAYRVPAGPTMRFRLRGLSNGRSGETLREGYALLRLEHRF